MPWFGKSREQAADDGSAMYQLSSKESIADFIARHDGAHTDAIVEYMTEVYGLSEGAVREHLSDLSRGGQIAPRYSGGRDASGQRAIGYDVPSDHYNGDDGL